MHELVLGNRELDVMCALWDAGSGTVAEVRSRLPVTRAYTTVLTILRNLEAKAFVSHATEGTAFRFFPRVTRRAVQRSVLESLTNKLFDGSPTALVMRLLVMRLVEDEILAPSDLKELGT
jgi:predicted transcriptional regulator